MLLKHEPSASVCSAFVLLIIINVIYTHGFSFVCITFLHKKKVKPNYTLILTVFQIKRTLFFKNKVKHCDVVCWCCELTILTASSQDSSHQGSRYQHPHRPSAGGAVLWCAHGPQRQRLWSSGGNSANQPLCADVRQPAQPPQWSHSTSPHESLTCAKRVKNKFFISFQCAYLVFWKYCT